MPKMPKKKTSLKRSAKALGKALAPRQVQRAKAIIKFAKNATGEDLLSMMPKPRSIIEKVKRDTSMKKLRMMEAQGKINLSQPLSKLLKKKRR